MIMGALAFSGLLSIVAGLVSPGPVAMAVIFFVASFGTVTLDALGNIPFLRSVHPYERSEMTSVFRTYIVMSQLLPPAIRPAAADAPAGIRVRLHRRADDRARGHRRLPSAAAVGRLWGACPTLAALCGVRQSR